MLIYMVKSWLCEIIGWMFVITNFERDVLDGIDDEATYALFFFNLKYNSAMV